MRAANEMGETKRTREREREWNLCYATLFSDFVTNDLIMLINTFNCANCEVLGFCKFCAYIAMI